jgi:Ca-activated chloride channel homolog
VPELVNPAGLLWLSLLPLLLVPYWLRRRPNRRIVPALFLLAGIEPAQRVRLGGRLQLRPLLLLQLLLALITIAALCRPMWQATEVRSALVLDDSASMRTVEGSGETRFDTALRAAREAIAKDGANSWDVFALSPNPHDLGLALTPGQAQRTVSSARVGSCPHPDDAAMRAFLERLARDGYARVHIVTDRVAASAERLQVLHVGTPRPNVAITDVSLIPSAVAGRPALLNVALDNFSPRAVDLPFRVEEAQGGTVIDRRTVAIPPHQSSTVTVDVTSTARLTARIDARDALALDDEASIAARNAGKREVLLVAGDAGGLDTIAPLVGMHLEVTTADRYRPEMSRGRDLVVFHRSAPRELPDAAALYVLPPPAAFLPAPGARVDQPAITFVVPTHPVARYLNFAALRPRQALEFAALPGWQPVALAGAGAVLLERATPHPAVVSGIDFLPYLGERNRPMSILTLNLLSWMLHGLDPLGAGAAACTPLGRAESDLEHPGLLPLPASAPATARASERTRPLWPALTLAAIALLVCEAWFHRGRDGLAWTLRLLIAALLVAAWLEPTRAIAGAAPRAFVVADVSKSLLAATREHGLDRVGVEPSAPLLAFGARPIETTRVALASAIPRADDSQSDLESALLAAANDAPQDGPLFLVTDGWETRGDATHALASLRERRLRVYPIAESQPLGNDVAVRSLSLPAESAAGSAVRAEVVLRSDNDTLTTGRVLIRRGSTVLTNEAVRVAPGESALVRPLLLTGEGLVEFSAEFQPAEPAKDLDRRNDVAKGWVAVGGGKRILLVGHDARDNRELEHTLAQRGFRVTAVARAAGQPFPDASRFTAVILNDVPLSDLPADAPAQLRESVHAGSGLVMVGGPRSFGLGGYRGSPIEDALPVRMKERARQEPRNAIALVIDKSGSMREEQRIVFAREAARQLVEHLKPHDRIAVIGFDREPFTIVPLSDVEEIRDDFEDRIDRLRPSGGTRLFPALQEARRELAAESAKRRHIVVLSDGLSEDAETALGRRQYYDLALALAEQGVTISTIALGRDADADFLQRLASYGRGAFHDTVDAATLPDILIGEFETHGREETVPEREFRPLPSSDSPLVGEVAKSDSRWPVVLGLVETELKRDARRDVAVAGSEAPLIASWEYGRGRAVAFTTDADGRWSDRWLRWKEWSRLWNDVARWVVPQGHGAQPRFALAYRGGALEIDYSRFDEDPAGAVTARIATPDGHSAETPLERAAAGHYRGRFVTRLPGDYRVELRGSRGAITETPLGFTVPSSATGEVPQREPNTALLETLARETGGEINPAQGRVEPAPTPQTRSPLAPLLLPIALVLFLIELIVRRLRSESEAF